MAWWPDDQWARMVAGDDCPMCADGHLPVNEHGELIAERPGSYVRLSANQTYAGYAVVIAKRHAPELHHLTDEELRLFWADVAALGRAISAVLAPVKLATMVMGNLCPHVHCHVIPQYRHDDPHGQLNPQHGEVRLDPDAWTERISALRAHLAPSP